MIDGAMSHAVGCLATPTDVLLARRITPSSSRACLHRGVIIHVLCNEFLEVILIYFLGVISIPAHQEGGVKKYRMISLKSMTLGGAIHM